MNYIALPIGFYCKEGRNKQTTSLRYATGFESWRAANEAAMELARELNLKSYTVISTLEKELVK